MPPSPTMKQSPFASLKFSAFVRFRTDSAVSLSLNALIFLLVGVQVVNGALLPIDL